jgi:ribonuclease R
LERDYYHRDPSGTKLVGERTGTTYGLTDRMRVKLAGVNLEERKIDFMPVEAAPAQGRARGRHRG